MWVIIIKKEITHKINNRKHKYKTICAGINCSNKPTSRLKIKYINKVGNFCKICADDLLKSELAEKFSVWDDLAKVKRSKLVKSIKKSFPTEQIVKQFKDYVKFEESLGPE